MNKKYCKKCRHAIEKDNRLLCREPKMLKAIREQLNKDAEEIDVTDVDLEGWCEKFERMKE